jgi:hypothetical protein
MTTIASAVLAGIGVLFAGSLAWGLALAPLNLRLCGRLHGSQCLPAPESEALDVNASVAPE